ncbi:MAG TPA: hypothetical protein PLR99_24735 [Polyangiaceae bacterium]|nr:hypothetical protein [Polyangiaceae bacterium]
MTEPLPEPTQAPTPKPSVPATPERDRPGGLPEIQEPPQEPPGRPAYDPPPPDLRGAR